MNEAVLDAIETERAALREVNLIREEYLGADALPTLPRGRVHDFKECPVARALEGLVTENYIYLRPDTEEQEAIQLPQAVMRFVYMFDHGRFTHLEE